jgi:uncharacterized protein (TIGR01777 family)
VNRPPKAPKRIAIAGASGFIGSALASHLESLGHAIIRIGRKEDTRHGNVKWDPVSGVFDESKLEGVRIVVNLAGEEIGQRWTPDRRQRILDSRICSTDVRAKACAKLDPHPKVLVNMSAMGYYGSRGDEVLDESAARGKGFLAHVVEKWESAADPARAAGVRVVHPRSGLILNPSGGVLQRLLPVFRLGAGGTIGGGQQWMSWISRTDAVRALAWVALHDSMEGPVNLATPQPVRNTEFTRELARALRRPALATVPEFAVKFMFGEMGEETLLASQRLAPTLLEESGFAFEYPTLAAALAHELNSA